MNRTSGIYCIYHLCHVRGSYVDSKKSNPKNNCLNSSRWVDFFRPRKIPIGSANRVKFHDVTIPEKVGKNSEGELKIGQIPHLTFLVNRDVIKKCKGWEGKGAFFFGCFGVHFRTKI